jgi:hypothetical protein
MSVAIQYSPKKPHKMPKLTRTRLAEVRAVLDASLFTSAGFQIETGTPINNLIVSVMLLDTPKCYIKLQYEEKKLSSFGLMQLRVSSPLTDSPPTVMVIYQSPGDFVETESSEVADFPSFIDHLRMWTKLLKSEVLFVDLFEKRLSEFQSELTKRLDEHCADPKVHFTDTERDELMRSLRDLQERISKLEESDDSLRTEVAEMKQTLTELARASIALPKRTWYRTACSKLFEISTRAMASKPGQKLLEGAIDRLLEPPKGG